MMGVCLKVRSGSIREALDKQTHEHPSPQIPAMPGLPAIGSKENIVGHRFPSSIVHRCWLRVYPCFGVRYRANV